MTMTRACALTDLDEGTPVSVDIDGEDVALVKVGEEVFAIRDECSHANIALSEGDVDGCTLECWMHGSRFDLRTGEPTGLPATQPVPVFRVHVDGTDVYVDIDDELNADQADSA
jgi:3-phenylpropionate/trans-cinnamate dioxygenase ferredoxin component